MEETDTEVVRKLIFQAIAECTDLSLLDLIYTLLRSEDA